MFPTYTYAINYDPSFGNKYRILRKEIKWFAEWKDVNGYETYEKAVEDLKIIRKFPEYYE